jgi:hypothetical protein
MSSNPEQMSRLSLLFRALVLTVVMALMSGRLEVKKFDLVFQEQSHPLKAAKLASHSWSPSTHYLTRSLLQSDRD